MSAYRVALGGVTAALAVVIMSLGGLIPLFTYILPVFCCVMLQVLRGKLGKNGAWVWYGAVSLLALLFCPDKEAAILYVFYGSFPNIRPVFGRKFLGTFAKLLYFNAVAVFAYFLMIHLLGLENVCNEFEGIGVLMLMLTLLLANVTFFLLDRALSKIESRMKV